MKCYILHPLQSIEIMLIYVILRWFKNTFLIDKNS